MNHNKYRNNDKINDHNYYGTFHLNNEKRSVPAHRASWIIHYGEIPEGLFVLHNCDNPGCVNPDHLKLGTQLDNMRNRIQRKRGHLRGTHCKKGHPFTRVFVRKNGQFTQQCYTCRNEAQKKHYWKNCPEVVDVK